jgi:transcriptional regulator with XRE-family HTH domain
MPTSESVPGLPARKSTKKPKATAAQRLARALKAWSRSDLLVACGRIGMDWRPAVRAQGGRDVNASAYLTLCALVGIDPFTGATVPPREEKIEIIWWAFGAGLVLARVGRHDMGVRDLEAETGVSIATISRVENAKPTGTEAFLALMRFIDVPISRFTGNGGNTNAEVKQ